MPEEAMTKFSQLGLAKPVLKAVDEVGYEAPTQIQAEAIPPLLDGRDLVGQAQTGTGKTAAFALPLLSRLDLKQREPQILVLTPTRELAIQVAEAMQTYARKLKGFHVVPVYGGQSIEVQLRKLLRGVHAVVGTPGRIRDHLRRGTLRLDSLKALVLDEADEMLRMGFIEEVESILDHTPAEKQVALFSATMPAPIRKVASKYLRDPVEVRSKAETATVKTVRQRYWRVAGVNKLHALTRILEVEDFDAMLVFVRTRHATAELAEKLEARGFASAPLSGDMNQAMRERVVDRLKKGRLDIVVATDVAARGLDVDRISHVVNFDIPWDVEAYVHRIGRTGRAGRKGEAILFVSPRERRMLFTIERVTGQPIEKMLLPTHADVVGRRVAQFKERITETLESQDLTPFNELIESYLQEQDTELPAVAAALAFLAQRDKPLSIPSGRPQSNKPAFRDTARQESGRRESGRREASDRDPARGREPRKRRRDVDGGRPAKTFMGGPKDDRVLMQRYQIEVGRDHDVEPGNIVGAISNEAELDGRYIGQIRIFDTFSLVDLPEGMPPEILRHLKKVKVRGQALRIRLADNRKMADRPHGKGPGKGPKGFKKKQRHKKQRLKKDRVKKDRVKKDRVKKSRAQRRASKSSKKS